jgi:hypothetical protein
MDNFAPVLPVLTNLVKVCQIKVKYSSLYQVWSNVVKEGI